ncbi:Phosphate-specific transport system accessory protein PhoU [Syntrophobacter sp. SbD1]|nr:Phosphate-specific transport system accessory protein PhoU [Syntrophobacter sp. SbD1]
MRTTLQKEMVRVQDELIDLGVMVERTLTESVKILARRAAGEAEAMIEADSEINRRRYMIESQTLVLIATQQPMAKDLRTLAAILEIAGELERIADYSKGIAKISIQLGSHPLVKPLVDVPRMAELASDMLHRALLAFVDKDAETARAIPTEDQQIDNLYDQVYRELMTYVLADPRHIDGASHLIWVAHNLERAADRAVNICERVIFMVTGELIEFEDLPRNPPGDQDFLNKSNAR